MNSNKLDDLITQSEAARLRGVSPEAIADLIRRGRLTPVEIAGRNHLRRSEVLGFTEKPAGRPPKVKIEQNGKKKGNRK